MLNSNDLSIKVYCSNRTDQQRQIESAWLCHVSFDCVIVCIKLYEKGKSPGAYMGKGIWFGDQFLTVDGLDWDNYHTFAETSRYTCFFCIFNKNVNEDNLPVAHQWFGNETLPFDHYFTK